MPTDKRAAFRQDVEDVFIEFEGGDLTQDEAIDRIVTSHETSI